MRDFNNNIKLFCDLKGLNIDWAVKNIQQISGFSDRIKAIIFDGNKINNALSDDELK